MTILYHKNCMDGLASAYTAWRFYNEQPETIPVSYDDTIQDLTQDKELLFVDFCPALDWLLENAKNYDKITIIDHHAKNVQPVQDSLDSLPNVTLYFDNDECGATLTYRTLFRETPPKVLQYIKDRDLWQWKLPNSKEFSEGLRHLVRPNNLLDLHTALSLPIEDVIAKGTLLVEATNKQVDSRLSDAKPVTINNINCMCLNATSNMPELGNALCHKYNLPSATYQIGPEGQVWWSFRSLDSLPAVDDLAISLGGGGHRNASGATKDLNHLQLTLKGDK